MKTPIRSTLSVDNSMETPRRSARIARIQKRTQVSLENGRGFSLVEKTVVEHGPYFKAYVYVLESFIPLVSWGCSLVLRLLYFLKKYGKVLAILGLLYASILLSLRYFKFPELQSTFGLLHWKVVETASVADYPPNVLEDTRTIFEETEVEETEETLNTFENRELERVLEKVSSLEKVVQEMGQDSRKIIQEQVEKQVQKTWVLGKKQVKDMIEQVVKKDSRVDYALNSRGGRVIQASRDYKIGLKSSWLKWMFPNVKRESRNRVQEVLESTKRPGDCWAMEGANGFVDIGLSQSIIPKAVVIQYASLQEISGFKTAPKRIQVFSKNILLGNGTFDPRDENSSVLNLKNVSKPIESLRVNVLSNWGHQDYTCIYQIQVFS